MPSKIVSLETISKKLDRLEAELSEIRFAVLPVEKISQKERAELDKISASMRKGNFITFEQAVNALTK